MSKCAGTRIDWNAVKSRLHAVQRVDEQDTADVDARVQGIFRLRAQRLATETRKSSPAADSLPVLLFKLGLETYGVELRCIAQVFPSTPITLVPGAPDEMIGVANLQGEVRSVFSLRRLLKLPGGDQEANQYILLLRLDERRVALQVESVEAVQRLVLDQLDELENAPSGQCCGYIKGVTPENIIVFRTDKLFDI